jgi:Protein of unknown function (DUF2878)
MLVFEWSQNARRNIPQRGPAVSKAVNRTRIVSNFLAFQVAWFVCVWGGAHERVGLGVLWVAITVVAHIVLAPRVKTEATLVALVTLLGTVWESAVVVMGLVRYPFGNFFALMPPIWIIAMWALFAIVLNVSLRWMKGRPLTAAIFGFMGAPLSYWAGYRMGAIQTDGLPLFLIAQAAGWAVLMPLVVRLAMRFDGYKAPAE